MMATAQSIESIDPAQLEPLKAANLRKIVRSDTRLSDSIVVYKNERTYSPMYYAAIDDDGTLIVDNRHHYSPEPSRADKKRRSMLHTALASTTGFGEDEGFGEAVQSIRSAERFASRSGYDELALGAKSLGDGLDKRRHEHLGGRIVELNEVLSGEEPETVVVRLAGRQYQRVAQLAGFFLNETKVAGEARLAPGLILADKRGELGGVPRGCQVLGGYVKVELQQL